LNYPEIRLGQIGGLIMFLFTRNARLAGGNGTAGMEWAVEMCGKVNDLTDIDVSLWATVYSEGFGTIGFTSFLPDLATLEAAGDTLQGNADYVAASDKGAALTEGGLDDQLLEIVYGEPDPSRELQYVSGVQAVCANGAIAKGMAAGVEIAQRAEKITGTTGIFVRGVTGPYASVGWLTGYESIGELEAAQAAMGADPEWVPFLDSVVGDAYIGSPEHTKSTIYRKLA
jgi:hypothetical protein